MRLSLCVFFLLLLSSLRLLGQNISEVKPSSAREGEPVEIVGTGFGDPKTTDDWGKVTIGGKDAKAYKWEDKSIIAVVPKGVAIGQADVIVTPKDSKGAGKASNV